MQVKEEHKMKKYIEPNVEFGEVETCDCVCASEETRAIFANQLGIWDEN